MKTIANWRDLEAYGIDVLTGESCVLGYRLLCDLTERGKQVLECCLDCKLQLAEPWNSGTAESPHVGSVMLTPTMLTAIGVFAPLESGCTEVWLYKNGSLLGVEPTDSPEMVGLSRDVCNEALVRTFTYRGTAADRNLHLATGRVR